MLWYRGDLMLQGPSALGQNGKMIQFNPYLIRFLISMEWHELTSFLEQFWRCVIFNFLWHKYYSLENAIGFFPFWKFFLHVHCINCNWMAWCRHSNLWGWCLKPEQLPWSYLLVQPFCASYTNLRVFKKYTMFSYIFQMYIWRQKRQKYFE